MRPLIAFMLAASVLGGTAAAQESSADQREALRSRITERFDIVPLTNAVALRPKKPFRDVRLVEIAADGSVSINGQPVTGREIRDRLGAEADAVIRLSQMDAETRRGLFAATPETPVEEPVEAGEPPKVEPSEPDPPRSERTRPRNRSRGDRVQVFGNITIDEDEAIGGQAVAVMGSVRVDGEVGQQVVAVLGSVTLGPNARVGGDVVSVGGRVHRAEGSVVRGTITQVPLADADIPVHINWPNIWWGPPHMFPGFGGVQRLIGTGFRLLLLLLFTGLAFVIARPTVEAATHRVGDNPAQATFVGLAAEILLVPLLILTSIILVVTIIGIPLLLLMPFIVLLLILMALVGFTGVAAAVGQWFRRRTGMTTPPGFGDVAVGLVVILLPVLVGRIIALGGWGLSPIGFLFVMIGTLVEFLAWTAGFGAVLTNAFSRWQARRTPTPSA